MFGHCELVTGELRLETHQGQKKINDEEWGFLFLFRIRSQFSSKLFGKLISESFQNKIPAKKIAGLPDLQIEPTREE